MPCTLAASESGPWFIFSWSFPFIQFKLTPEAGWDESEELEGSKEGKSEEEEEEEEE